jgi:hypothetical protein
VPDQHFAWLPGSGGDGVSYQTVYGSGVVFGSDLAFGLSSVEVPEPSAYALIAGLGLVGFGLYRRMRS